MGFRFAGLSRGFGGAFDLNVTPVPGGVPISESVASSELAVTGTFSARAPTLLSQAAAYEAQGVVTQPTVRYGDGTVIGATSPTNSSVPAGWSPDPRTWGSPESAVQGALQTASSQAQQAHEDALNPAATPPPTVIDASMDGQWMVDESGLQFFVDTAGNVYDEVGNLVRQAKASGMKWWHWALIGGAVLGVGYALTR
jgi:hypothetical protein